MTRAIISMSESRGRGIAWPSGMTAAASGMESRWLSAGIFRGCLYSDVMHDPRISPPEAGRSSQVLTVERTSILETGDDGCGRVDA